ncbi:MAG: DUF1080 domain-containing protein [Armatimonadetes bacterium]|nr:DUF1080 domain-containing protein [Armatimonadota bacterium]
MLSLALFFAIATSPSDSGQFHIAPQNGHNELTQAEKRQGFELLFDGKSLSNFRAYKRDDVPKGWVVKGGEITYTPDVGGGDLMTREQYEDFDLRIEFKMNKRGNSGIIYLVSEDFGASFHTGPEYQLLDDENYDITDLHTTGSNYALHAPTKSVMRSAGRWNEARIVKKGNHVEHYLNGVMVVEYVLHDEDWDERRAASKFKDFPGYGKNNSGYICFQDHGGPMWFRSMRIRRL